VGAGLAGQRSSLTIPPIMAAEQPMRRTGEVSSARGMPSPDQALRRLMTGNQRYTMSRSTILSDLRARRQETANGQHPFAAILGCADSRVPVEVVFDHGIGEIFTIRVAGNTLNDLVTGSLEFALEELHVPLIMVLGHQRCGAVKAAIDSVDSGKPAPGNIDAVIRSIRPVIASIGGQGDERLANGVWANVRAVVNQIKANPVVAGLTSERRLRVVGAYYTLGSGKVDIVA
jgi:carbonic anhydrase